MSQLSQACSPPPTGENTKHFASMATFLYFGDAFNIASLLVPNST